MIGGTVDWNEIARVCNGAPASLIFEFDAVAQLISFRAALGDRNALLLYRIPYLVQIAHAVSSGAVVIGSACTRNIVALLGFVAECLTGLKL